MVAWGLLGDPSAVDDELGAGYVGGLVGGEVDDPVGDLLGLADAAHGDLGEHVLSELLIIVHVGRHGGLDGAGVDGVAADVVLGVVDGDGLGEDADGALGGLVGGMAGVGADDAELGGDVDDGAAAGVLHGGDGGDGAEVDAGGVDVHDGVPGLLGEVAEPGGTADAGVVDEDIQFAEVGDGEVDGGLPVVLPGDVQPDEASVAAGGVDVCFNLTSFIFEDVADDDGCALGGEESGFHGAHASGAA